MPPTNAIPTPYYPALTGVRAVAAFMVFGFHHRHLHGLGASGTGTALRALLGELHTGVSIFFTLSGYLITVRYAAVRFDGAEWRRYLLHRVARIWPVYLALVLATFAASYPTEGRHDLGRWLREFGASLTLLKGFVRGWYLTGIAQSWSLTVEECFYLLAPLVFWLGRRGRPGRAWPLLALGVAALGLGLYAALPALGTPLFGLKATIFGRLSEFLLGAAFAWFAPRTRRATIVGAALLALVFGLLVAIQLLTKQVSIDYYPGALVNNLLLPVGTAWLLHGLATEPTRLSWVLSTPLAQHLGRASYCFYLVHLGLLPDTLQPLLAHWLAPVPALSALFGLLVLASLVLHYGLEQPAYRWLLARFEGRRAALSTSLPLPASRA